MSETTITVPELLEKIKRKHPELRYGQIVAGAMMKANRSYDTFYLEDADFVRILMNCFGEDLE